MHWACQKISACLQQPDEELKEVLRSKLQKYRGVQYSLIAGHAESVGRKGLATLLLEYETCAADQVHTSACRWHVASSCITAGTPVKQCFF